MLRKIKLGLWIIVPIFAGILIASLFFGSTTKTRVTENGLTVGIIEQEPEVKEPDFIKMIFAGDIMMDRGVRSSVIKYFDGDYNRLFENLGMLKDFDIAFANLEGPASDKGRDKRNLYSFRMDPLVIPALKQAGMSIVSFANNHVGDWEINAFTDTLARLKESQILYTGGGIDSVEAETPTIIEKNGMKIGFLGFSDVGPSSMEVQIDKAGLLLASNPRFDEIIQNAAKQVDYLIVSFHWGTEYKTIHNKRQEYLAHKAVDAGAKIIIGHHPHVPQDTEVYKNSLCLAEASCEGGYIAYSLGNFIFDQSWSEPTMKGMLLEIKLNKDGNMNVRKYHFKLNKFFQPNEIILGEE